MSARPAQGRSDPGAGASARPGDRLQPGDRMSDLETMLGRLGGHEGVELVMLTGRDGLLVRQSGGSPSLDVDTVAALVPGVAGACQALGQAAGRGDFGTAVVELAAGVAIVTSLSEELLLTLLVRHGVGFAPLLRELRRQRPSLAALL